MTRISVLILNSNTYKEFENVMKLKLKFHLHKNKTYIMHYAT